MTIFIEWRERYWSKSTLVTGFLLISILSLGLFFRLYNTNWDEGQHIHPDERFLTMVVNDISFPDDLSTYFDTKTSSLNPHNSKFHLFVYGTFPLFLLKAISGIGGPMGYDQIHLLGRTLSGLFDGLTIFLIFLIGRRLYDKWVGLFAAFLFAATVIHIQQSHFLVVDTFLTFFITFSVYWVIRLIEDGKTRWFILAGLSLGTAMACKITGGILGIAVLGLTLFLIIQKWSWRFSWRLVGKMALIVVFMFIAFRVFQPYAFQGDSLFSVKLNPRFVSNIQEVKRIATGEGEVPYTVQWANRTNYLFPIYNLFFWSMGIFSFTASMAGLIFLGYRIWKYRRAEEFFYFIWILIYFLYTGQFFLKTLRYYMPIIPFMEIAGAAACVMFYRNFRSHPANWIRYVSTATLYVVGIGTLAFAFSYLSIYRHPLTRITASKWIYTHVPPRSAVANEHWDDPLPLNLGPLNGSRYQGHTLTLYDDDSKQKLRKLLQTLDAVDYIFLSSNRLYHSIPRLPMRYPMTVKYYQYLFSGELGFELVRVFTSYPTLFGISLIDDSAEEAYSVYDHPKVLIFRKKEDFDIERVKSLLSDVNWNSIRRVRPIDASKEDYEIPRIEVGQVTFPEQEPETEVIRSDEPPSLPTPKPVNLFKTTFGEWESYFNQPRGVAVDSNSNIYVTDFHNHRIQKFDLDGNFIKSWGKSGAFEGEFKEPTGIRIDKNDRIFVSDTWNQRIQVFNSEGEFLQIIGEDASFYGPRDLTLSDDGRLFVSDTGNRRIMVFSPDGSLIKRFSTPPDLEGADFMPIGLEISDNILYVVSVNDSKIYLFDLNGNYQRQIDLKPIFTEPMRETYITFSKTGDLIVSSAGQNRLVRIDQQGNVIKEFIRGKTGAFAHPTGLSFIPDGRLLVVDTHHHNVQFLENLEGNE